MTSPTPPASFEPLADSDQTPGDADRVRTLAGRYRTASDEIVRQAGQLNTLGGQSSEGWKGQAGQVFSSHATGLAGRVLKVKDRYDAAATALFGWADAMVQHQSDAYAAVRAAQDAQQRVQANQPGPPAPAGSPPPSDADVAADQARQGRLGDAQSDLAAATHRYQAAVGAYNSSAARYAGPLSHEASHDGLKDSWWDRNFHWLRTAFEIIAVVVVVLAIAAVVLACPAVLAALAELMVDSSLFAATTTAEALATLGTATTVVQLAGVGLTAASAVFDGIAAGTGKSSWTNFALDIVGLASFGLGAGLGKAVEGLAEGGETAAKAIAGGRAGRAALGARGIPGFVFSLANSSDRVAGVLSKLPGLGGALDSAFEASGKASEAVEAGLKGITGSNLVAALSADGDMARDLAKLGSLAEEFPTSLRIGLRSAVGSVAGVTNMAVQAGNAAQTIGNTVRNLHDDWSDTTGDIGTVATGAAHGLEHLIQQTGGGYVGPLFHAPTVSP